MRDGQKIKAQRGETHSVQSYVAARNLITASRFPSVTRVSLFSIDIYVPQVRSTVTDKGSEQQISTAVHIASSQLRTGVRGT
jgi:hypothetical protein